jgi:hypothetical protein|tara:strand:- start:1250 stop:1489 length:240 start_codon:yes stop_codon:yes gene_type:complete
MHEILASFGLSSGWIGIILGVTCAGIGYLIGKSTALINKIDVMTVMLDELIERRLIRTKTEKVGKDKIVHLVEWDSEED